MIIYIFIFTIVKIVVKWEKNMIPSLLFDLLFPPLFSLSLLSFHCSFNHYSLLFLLSRFLLFTWLLSLSFFSSIYRCSLSSSIPFPLSNHSPFATLLVLPLLSPLPRPQPLFLSMEEGRALLLDVCNNLFESRQAGVGRGDLLPVYDWPYDAEKLLRELGRAPNYPYY